MSCSQMRCGSEVYARRLRRTRAKVGLVRAITPIAAFLLVADNRQRRHHIAVGITSG